MSCKFMNYRMNPTTWGEERSSVFSRIQHETCSQLDFLSGGVLVSYLSNMDDYSLSPLAEPTEQMLWHHWNLPVQVVLEAEYRLGLAFVMVCENVGSALSAGSGLLVRGDRRRSQEGSHIQDRKPAELHLSDIRAFVLPPKVVLSPLVSKIVLRHHVVGSS